MSLDVNWHNAEMECEGGPRPDGSGVRVAFAGPRHPDGRRLRLVFGVESLQEGHPARDVPTNLTVIFEGEQRLFATRGDDHCTVDELRQERIGALGGAQRSWRIVARGFCIAAGEQPQRRCPHPGEQLRFRRRGPVRRSADRSRRTPATAPDQKL